MSTAKYFRPLRKMSYAATCLVALISVSGLAREVLAAVPEICRVQGGNTKTIWGAGLDRGLGLESAVRRGGGLGGIECHAL